MFEKLLSLLLHAKGGAVATVLVLGASGALVTATVENGVANITVTQPSQTTTGTNTTTGSTTTSTNTTLTQQILSLFNRTNAQDDPTAPATGNGCSDAAHATNEQVKRVNEAFKIDHAAVRDLAKSAPKTEEARKLVKDADSKIKDIREAAVKAIHELFKSDECKGHDNDEDEANEANDEDDDNGATGATGSAGTTSTTTTTTTVAISGTDAKAIADAAIAEMDKVVADLKADLAKLPAAPTTTNTNNTNKGEKAKTESKSGKGDSNKGKGHSEGRSHEDND